MAALENDAYIVTVPCYSSNKMQLANTSAIQNPAPYVHAW